MTRRFQQLGLAASLALNAVLAAVVLRPERSEALPAALPAALPSAHLDAEATATRVAPAPDARAVGTAAAPLLWSQIESDDYRQYIANLRAVGCPEETIRDVISADLGAVYTARARAIWSPAKLEYWQKDERGGPTPDQARQLAALEREEAAASRELLGRAVSPQERIDLLFLQLHGAERQLLYLTEEKRAAALAVLQDSGMNQREQELLGQGQYSSEQERRLFDDKLKHLAKVLSPEEVEEFRLRHAPEATWLRTELQYFDCTPEEFQRLLDARQQTRGQGPQHDLLNREAATEQVRTLFGDARASEFERVTDLHYQQARRTVDRLGLPAELADQAWAICRDARQAAQQTAANTAAPLEDRILKVRSIQEDADRRLNDVLGETASRAVRRDLKTLLRGTETGIRP